MSVVNITEHLQQAFEVIKGKVLVSGQNECNTSISKTMAVEVFTSAYF